MGERMKKNQAQKFRHAQDAAYDQLSVPDLIRSARPDIVVDELGCGLEAGGPGVGPDAALMLHEDAGGGGVKVVHGNAVVGTLDAASAERVREVLTRAGGTLCCKLGRAPGVTDFFTVKVDAGGDGGRRRK